MKNLFKLGEAAAYVNVSPKTLQKYDREGTLVAQRTATGRRFYSRDQLDAFLGREPQGPNDSRRRRTVIYARVSSYSQKAELTHQVDYLVQWAKNAGFNHAEVLTDIGSGLNYKRKNWNKILYADDIDTVIIAYRDRFVRFGYEWFSNFLISKGTKIIECQHRESSPEQELTDDLISIIHVFSSRVYGLRKYKKEVTGESFQDGDQTERRSEDISI